MTRQNGDWINQQHLLQGSPVNATHVETFPVWNCGTDNAIAATGVEHTTAIAFQAGDVVTSLQFVTGGTAAGTPTAGYMVLRGTDGAKLVQTADFGSTARAANTAYTVALTAAYTIPAAGVYYVGISFTAATIPTLRGVTVGNAVMAGALGQGKKILAQSHGAAVGAVAPATIATPTTLATPCYFLAV